MHCLMNIHDGLRYDPEDCSRRTDLPDFAPLSDHGLFPELQLKYEVVLHVYIAIYHI